MDIDRIFNIYKELYNETGSIEYLKILLYVKENGQGDEIFVGELIVYNEYAPDVNGIEPLFTMKNKIGNFFIDFINIDTNIIGQLLNKLNKIIVYDDITLGYFLDNFVKVAQDWDSRGLSLETIDNYRISNSACEIIEELLTIHPYMLCLLDTYLELRLFPGDPLSLPSLSVYKNRLNHLIELIEVCREIIDFTFCHIEQFHGLEHLDAMTRYYIYTSYVLEPKCKFDNLPTKTFEFVFLTPLQKLSENSSLQEVINAYQNVQLHYDAISYLDVGSGDNTCSEAIINLIQNGKIVQKCKLCKRYYITKGNHKSYYCSNLYRDSGKTCQQIAAANNHKNKKKSNPILYEFDKAYKRNYARVSTHKISKEDFRIWTEQATKRRKEAMDLYATAPSEDIIKEFKEYLGNR